MQPRECAERKNPTRSLTISRMKPAYDPAARHGLEVTEQEFRRTARGRTLMARIYRPKGDEIGRAHV